MSVAGHVSLPRTRSFRRAGTQRLWWIAVGTAIAANLGMVLLLAQVSRLHPPAAAAPLAVRTLRQAPEPEPPPAEQIPQEATMAIAEAAPIALPSLELPALPTMSAIQLPAFGSTDPAISLPMAVPAFTAVGIPGEGPPAAGQAGLPAFDTPAQREGTFDLDRYYPRSARLRSVTGSTRLRLSISAEGRVAGVEVLESTPPGVFERAAERLADSLRFRPATAAGVPVASVQDTTITWTMK